jgi:hypothetical protein
MAMAPFWKRSQENKLPGETNCTAAIFACPVFFPGRLPGALPPGKNSGLSAAPARKREGNAPDSPFRALRFGAAVRGLSSCGLPHRAVREACQSLRGLPIAAFFM